MYVGSLSADVSELELKRQFGAFGPINEVKCYNKGERRATMFLLCVGPSTQLLELLGRSNTFVEVSKVLSFASTMPAGRSRSA